MKNKKILYAAILFVVVILGAYALFLILPTLITLAGNALFFAAMLLVLLLIVTGIIFLVNKINKN